MGEMTKVGIGAVVCETYEGDCLPQVSRSAASAHLFRCSAARSSTERALARPRAQREGGRQVSLGLVLLCFPYVCWGVARERALLLAAVHLHHAGRDHAAWLAQVPLTLRIVDARRNRWLGWTRQAAPAAAGWCAMEVSC